MNNRSVKKATKSNKFLKLEMYRKKYKCNQSVFAQLLGVSTVTYCHKETRRNPFTYDELEILHKFINERASKCGDPYISMDELFLQ